MHELSIALSLIEMASEEAERRGGPRVEAIHLRLGALAGVVKDALLSAYDVAQEGSAIAGARLVIEDVPVVIDCAACGVERVPDGGRWFLCPVCGSPAARVVSGRELEVTALELDA